MLAGLVVLTGLAVAGRAAVPALVPAHAPRGRGRPREHATYPPPEPDAVWSGGSPTCRRSIDAMDERFKRSEFAIRLLASDDLFEPFDARPMANRPLNYDARMALLDQWSWPREKDPQWLTLYLPESERELTDEAGVRAAINADLKRPPDTCATSTR